MGSWNILSMVILNNNIHIDMINHASIMIWNGIQAVHSFLFHEYYQHYYHSGIYLIHACGNKAYEWAHDFMFLLLGIFNTNIHI